MLQIYSNVAPTPRLPPLLYASVLEFQRNDEAPAALILSSLLTALTTVCQSYIDVKWLNEIVSPTSLFLLTIADSGERKSRIDSQVMDAAIKHGEECRKEHIRCCAQFKLQHSAWKRKVDALKIQWRQLAKNSESTEELDKLISILESSEPLRPKLRKILASDITPESIVQSLNDNGGALCIYSSEGGLIMSGRAMRNHYLLNNSWGGASISVERKSCDPLYVDDPRLSIGIMIQPSVLEEQFRKNGNQLRGNGFLARTLISFPESTQGTRFNQGSSWEHLPLLQARFAEILKTPIWDADGTTIPRKVLKLGSEAEARLNQFNKLIETDLYSGNFLSDVRDAANKITENAARIAALFHFFQGLEGDISYSTMDSACAFASFYMMEFKRLFGSHPRLPPEYQDSFDLEQCIIRHCVRNPYTQKIDRARISQMVTGAMREDKPRRDAAIQSLQFQGKVQVFEIGRKKVISLNPQYFPICGNQVSQSLPNLTFQPYGNVLI